MNLRRVMLAGWCCALGGTAAQASPPEGQLDSQAATPRPANPSDDRLILIGDATRLAGTSGGGGQVTWLHEVGSTLKLVTGIEHQSIAGAEWTVGSASAALSCTAHPTPSGQCNLYGELHEGSGRTGTQPFHYQILAAGVSYALTPHVTTQLEDRYFDVDTSVGHLPKLSLVLLAGRRWLTTLSYAHSAGGNLATELVGARLDLYLQDWHWLTGLAHGQATAAALDVQPAGKTSDRLAEGFVGIARPMGRNELGLLADYLDLGGRERVTLTLSYSLHLAR